MIKINLLPEELKISQKKKRNIEFKMPVITPRVWRIIGISAGMLAGLHIVFFISIMISTASYKELDKKWQSIQPDRIDAEKLIAQADGIEKKIAPIKKLTQDRILWARELNRISDLMTTGIWMNRLSIQSAKTLTIDGCAAALYGDETALIAAFMKALKDDREFSVYFDEIKMGPMQEAELEKNPIMRFKIYCTCRKT